MSTSYIKLTEEQKLKAKQTNLAEFLQSRGEELKKSGSEYEWFHHHITIRGNRWFNQYEQRGGMAIDFVKEQYGLSYPEAVQMLLDANISAIPISNYKKKEKQPFKLPPPNYNMRRVFAYLIKQRFIDREVIDYFTHRKMIYEDLKYHNAVFVGLDKNGIPKHAHKKSTSLNNSSFRGTVESSEAAFSFHHIGTDNMVFVFESPIDMLSFITLYKIRWQNHSYIALCCVGDTALLHQLKENPQINNIYLCLDNDNAGQKANERIWKHLTELKYSNISILKSNNKDWNEDLKEVNGIIPIKSEFEKQEENQCKLQI